jgi:glycosyltransferase involved in cell wall biosynthesis
MASPACDEIVPMNQARSHSRIGPESSIGIAERFTAPPAPRIGPPPERSARPLWSVMIPTYNSTAYLEETLRSLLAQDPGAEAMEIEVIDNCSTQDDPEPLVREIGRGRINYHRQTTNVGAIENFNTCIRRARGEWVYILHSDDVVRPGFFSAARKAIAAQPQVSAVVFRIIYMDEDGLWIGLSDPEARTPAILDENFVRRQLLDQRIQFVGMIVRRDAYEELGGFRPELKHCADWDMWNRLAVCKQLFYEPEPLACYRLHGGAQSSHVVRTGENVADERRCIRISLGYVPREQARHLHREALKAAAVRASRRMRHSWRNDDYGTALRQLREALRCSLAPVVLARLLCLLALVILERRHHGTSFRAAVRPTTGLATQKAEGWAAVRDTETDPIALVKAACVAVVASGSMADAVGAGESATSPVVSAPVIEATKEL